MKPIKRRALYPALSAFSADRRALLTLMAQGAAVTASGALLGCIVEETPTGPEAGAVEPDGGGAGISTEGNGGEPPLAGGEMAPDYGVPDAQIVEPDWGEPPLAGAAPQPDMGPPDAGEPPLAGGEPLPVDAGMIPDAAPIPAEAIRLPAEGSAYYFGSAEAAPDGFELMYYAVVETNNEALRLSLLEDQAGWLVRLNETLGYAEIACTGDADMPDVAALSARLTQDIIDYMRRVEGIGVQAQARYVFERCAAQLLAGEAPGW